MTSIVLTVTGAQAWASVTGPLTSGMVGIPVSIEYDETWNGLTKNLMCRCSSWGSNDGEIRTLLNVGDTSAVAHEVMQPDMYLYLGVEGFRSDGTLVIPTTWARCGKIEYGANTCEDLSADPELPIWNQLQTEVEQIKRDGYTQEQIDEIQAYVQSASQAANSAEKSKSNATAASNLAISNANLAEIYMKQAQTSAENASTSAGSAANLANGALQAQRAAEAAAARAEDAVGSLQDPYELPIGGDELGGVKNGGNVIINADGTMTAPDNAPTDEQVGSAVSDYLTEHPVTPGATEEEAAQILANKTNLEFATATDAALFATLETGSLYKVDLTGMEWTTDKSLCFDNNSQTWNNYSLSGTGNRYAANGYIHLRRGDVLITNADTRASKTLTNGTHISACLLQRMTRINSLYNSAGSVLLLEGREVYDGLYRCYTATEAEEFIRVSYKYEPGYDVHFYVAKARNDAEEVPYTYLSGYVKADTGEVVEVSDKRFAVGYNYEVVSQLITISAPGKFLLVKNVKGPAGRKGVYIWAKYDEGGAFEYGLRAVRWDSMRNYFIVPLFKDTEYIRLNYVISHNPYHLTEALLVDAEYLIRNGYADHVVGKSLTMFGDSYVAGHNIGSNNTWHYMFAEQHQMHYTNLGTNGLGLCKSPNIADGMIDRCDTLVDADYIGVICGRNDYSVQVPIGTNDDVSTPEMSVGERTFKGGLNYLCQYLVENFPGRKVFFLTPWFFPSTDGLTETHKPVEYIDAILEITGLWGIPCFDAARRSGIHCRSEAFRTTYFLSASDVSHLNETGAKLMLDNITGWMLGL